MINNNSTIFLASEKIGLVLGKCVRKILVISGVGLLVKYIKKNSWVSKMHYLVLEKNYLLRLLRHVSKLVAAYVLAL